MSRRSLYTMHALYSPEVAMIHVCGVDPAGQVVTASSRYMEASAQLMRAVEESIYVALVEGPVSRYAVKRTQQVSRDGADGECSLEINITVPSETAEAVFSQIAVEFLSRSRGDRLVAPDPEWAVGFVMQHLPRQYAVDPGELKVEEAAPAFMETTVVLQDRMYRYNCEVRASSSGALRTVRVMRGLLESDAAG